jgi:PAS domain S-box-containing protein
MTHGPGAVDGEALRRFLQFDDAEDAALRAAGGALLAGDRDEFVEAFYRHLMGFDEPRRILSDPGRVEHLKRSLAAYLDSLFTSELSDAYMAERTRIGQAHLRAGLLPRWYLGAYTFFTSWWIPRLAPGDGGPARVRAFLRRILLDSVLAMETYVSARVEGLAREKETLGLEARNRARQLFESEQRYEDLVENAPEMIHQIGPDRVFVGANRTELARLGYSLDEMRAMRVEEVVPPAYRRGLLEHFERARDEGQSRLETIFRTKSGEEFPVEIDETAQYDAGGAFVQTRAFVRDLSVTKQLERELVRWERLAAVGSMAAKVAHEIRNPLSAISLNAELLADEAALLPRKSRSEAERLLTTILGEVDRLNAIIEEYLAFARLPRVRFHEVSLQEVFYRLEQLLGQEMGRRGIRLTIAGEDDLPAIHGDTHQIEQVFLNLLRNSEDAMPNGGEVRVTARTVPDGVEISVRDDGLGIPQKSIPLIFDPFFTTKDTGTGLGLAYVQQVLREHGGRIECRSEVNAGTEFLLVLPTGTPAATATSDERPGGDGGRANRG